MDRNAFRNAVYGLGLDLTDEQIDQFEAFEDRLYEANQVMNLTRIPKDECWLRHFVDSLLFQDLVPKRATVLDIGTGPGFPAWPLACARSDLRVTALDSSGKMLSFLGNSPLPNLTTALARVEEWGVREKFDVVTGRAVAPLAVQLELSAPPCRVKGAVLPMRTPSDEAEIRAFNGQGLGLKLEACERRTLPGTDIERLFPVFRKIAKTDRRYPRTWAEIKRQPLR